MVPDRERFSGAGFAYAKSWMWVCFVSCEDAVAAETAVVHVCVLRSSSDSTTGPGRDILAFRAACAFAVCLSARGHHQGSLVGGVGDFELGLQAVKDEGCDVCPSWDFFETHELFWRRGLGGGWSCRTGGRALLMSRMRWMGESGPKGCL